MTQEQCQSEIQRHIDLINSAIKWGNDYRGGDFPAAPFKKWRRELKKMKDSLASKCSAAAYGESQVGKSYLISNLLSSPGVNFKIEGDGREYDFKTEINSSASTINEQEATGIVTRFTLKADDNGPANMVKIKNLSVVDVILMIVDSYYNDIKIDSDSELDTNDINEALREMSGLWSNQSQTYNILDEDDIWEIHDYVKDILGRKAIFLRNSKFAEIVGPVIKYVPLSEWVNIFELLWNKNQELNKLFVTLITAYDKLKFNREVYVPFDAVLWKKGTILDVQWLDLVGVKGGTENKKDSTIDVYNREGKLLARDFPKGDLSALISELTFEVDEKYAKERVFFKKMDLLDFPGARSRKSVNETEMESIIPKILRRGKVAYLFNKYSREMQVSSLLFCHHNNQQGSGGNLGDTINNWIKKNVGETPQERTKTLKNTEGHSPFFFIATKFNRDLEKLNVDSPSRIKDLDNHWGRFEKIIPEIVEPATWLEKWSVNSTGLELAFPGIYPLRDFEFSKKAGLFEGYTDANPKEDREGSYPDFPNYMSELKKSFLRNEFVVKHYPEPEKVWEEFATVNNDGSKPIIRELSAISDKLDEARYKKYLDRITEIREEMLNRLSTYYEASDAESRNQKVKTLAGMIRLDLTRVVSKDPVAFGKIMEKFMVEPEELRTIAFNIIMRHTESPEQFSRANFVLVTAGVNFEEPREVNIKRLLNRYGLKTEKELRETLKEDNLDLDDLLANQSWTITTVAELVAHRIVTYWKEHLDSVASDLSKYIPHASDIADMLKKLFKKLKLLPKMADRIKVYTQLFREEEQPNVIGDYTSLELNKFVTTVGREFMDDAMIRELQEKAAKCEVSVDCSPEGWNRTRRRQSLEHTLGVFDKYATIINNPGTQTELLNQLPFWSNYQRWENFLMMGLLFSSDISNVDPEANGAMGEIINNTKTLYE